MCGRYTFVPTKALQEKWQLSQKYDAVPGSSLPVIANQQVTHMQWGIKPEWSRHQIINIRLETLTQKSTFSSIVKNRCLVPYTGFFEWQTLESGKKQPYYFQLKDQKISYFAGIFDQNNAYAIVTMPANQDVVSIHDRMPAILTKDNYQAWLDADKACNFDLKQTLTITPITSTKAFIQNI